MQNGGRNNDNEADSYGPRTANVNFFLIGLRWLFVVGHGRSIATHSNPNVYIQFEFFEFQKKIIRVVRRISLK